MAKLIAITNTIAWGGFWAFGLLALTTPLQDTGSLMTAIALATMGGFLGLGTYMALVRHSEATGYAAPANRVV